MWLLRKTVPAGLRAIGSSFGLQEVALNPARRGRNKGTRVFARALILRAVSGKSNVPSAPETTLDRWLGVGLRW